MKIGCVSYYCFMLGEGGAITIEYQVEETSPAVG
jgi:hypothetical protein